MTITTNYTGIGAFYFYKIINEIIKIAKLDEEKKVILDYGCGEKILSSKLINNKVLNYDINPKYSEIPSIDEFKFDYVILNHVLMYMTKEEVNKLFHQIKKINYKSEFVIGIGKQNLLSKIGKNITFNFDAHDETILSYNDQIEIISESMSIINYKKNIFYMTDIYHTKFKN